MCVYIVYLCVYSVPLCIQFFLTCAFIFNTFFTSCFLEEKVCVRVRNTYYVVIFF